MTNIKTRNHKSYILPAMLLCAFIALLIAGALSVRTTQAVLTDSTEPIENNFSLYKKHTLSYHANAGMQEVTVPDTQTEYDTDNDGKVTFTLSDLKPVRKDGFIFVGWNTERDGAGTSYDPKATHTTDMRHTDLYAQWTTGYTLIYDANGGANPPNAETAESREETHTFTSLAGQEQMTGPEHKDPSDSDETSTDNRVFLGWSTNKEATEPEYTSDGKLAYDNAANDYDGTKMDGFSTELEIKAADNSSKTVTLYAVWATKYELKYALHPELNDPPSKAPIPTTQTKVSTERTWTFHIPKRVVAGEEGPGEVANAPTRDGGYEWGWWGDSLDRFGYVDGASNEGCYLFNEDLPNHHTWDEPTWTLYAYFQPPDGIYVYYYSNAYELNDNFEQTTTRKIVDPTQVTNMPKSPVGTVSTDIEVPTDITDKKPEHPKYEFLGWSANPDATEPDKFDNNQVVLDKRKSNVKRLYAVWQHKHKFRVSFNKNSDSSHTQYTYYINPSNGKWTYTSGGTNYYEKNGVINRESDYYLDESYTFDNEFFNTKGLFATRPNDSYGSYKFVGWSYTNYPTRGDSQYDKNNPEHVVEFPVELPDDPSLLYNQTAEGTIGKIRGTIKAEEDDPPCSEPKTHEVKLYAVWERSPLHNFSLTFGKNDNSTETMSRGTATANSYTYTYPGDYTNPRITTVRSIDNPTYTWKPESWTGETNQTTCPIVTKNSTDTATYEFIGWSKEKNKTSEEDVDYKIDMTTKLLKDPIKLGDDTEEEAKNCDGGTHSLTLYPVFKPVPRHKYSVYFDVNQPASLSLKGIETKLYYKKNDGSWDSYTRDKDTLRWDNSSIKSYGNQTDIEGISRSTSAGTIAFSELKNSETKSLSWPNDYISSNPVPTNGLFATCENKNATSSTEYKFMGWSYTKYTLTGNTRFIPGESTLEFPVTVPESPATSIGDGEGVLQNPVVIDIDESNPTSTYACTDTEGKVHNRVLYGVWTGEVLHQYSVTFDGNGAGSKVLYGSADDWVNGTTKDDSKPADGKCVNYSEAKKPAKTSNTDVDNYTFDSDYWTNNDVIAKAERTTGDGYEYTFAGWSLNPNTDASDTENIITVDGNGYITQDIIAECNKYPCDGSQVHDVKLYAVWNKRAVHRYSVIFYNDGTSGSVQTKSGTSWSNSSTTVGRNAADAKDLGLTSDLRYCHRLYSDYKYLDQTATAGTHKWDANTLAVRGAKKSTDDMEYTFLGWSETPVEPSLDYTPSSDVIKLHVDDKGIITDDIILEEPDELTDCQYDTHNKVYYPVFKMDPIHKFTVQFNNNGGNGIRYRNDSNSNWTYTSSSTRSYSHGPVKLSESGSSYTWGKDSFWNDEGIGAYRNTDAFYSYEFIGWSKTQQTTPIDPVPSDTINWRDDTESNLDGAGYIDEDITVNCPNPCNGGSHPTVTYYAVWKATPLTQTYNLQFDGNDASNPGISNMPGNIMDKTETYDDGGTYKGNTWYGYDFIIPTEIPMNKKMVFTGWSTNKNATQGEYGYRNNQNHQIAELTGGLDNTYHMTTRPSAYDATKTETMYAIWWYGFYLEYSANGGSQAPPLARTYKSADSYSFKLNSNIPVRDGYEFKGWSTDSTATTAQYQPGDSVLVRACTDPTDDDYGYGELKLYAVWGPVD